MSGECSSSQSENTDKASGDNINGNFDKQIKQNFITPLKILNLCANLSDEKSSVRIQAFLNKFIQQITNAPHIIIIPILLSNEEGLIQVINDKVLDDEIRFSITANDVRNASSRGYNFKIPDMNRNFKDVIEQLVGNENNTIYFDINEINKNLRSNLPALLPPKIESIYEDKSRSINCSIILNDEITLPPKNNDGILQITFFICIGGDESLRVYYRYCIYETLRFTLGHLLTAIELEEERRILNKCENLLKHSRNLLGKVSGRLIENREGPGNRQYVIKLDILRSMFFPCAYVYETKDFNLILDGIITEAKELVSAERCSLFLRDKHTGELISKLNNLNESPHNKIKIHRCIGIAGHVCETGKLLNIRNASTDPLFNPDIDEEDGFDTQNILCFPIFDQQNVLGVVELCNKLNGYHFDKCDEEVATAFSHYAAFSIMQALISTSVTKLEGRHKIEHELLLHHMKISEDEVKELVESLHNINKIKIPKLNSFTFITRDLDRKQSLEASLQMFNDLDFINKFKIRPDKLVRFLLIIEKAYRDLPFHNWMHAFSVAHFSYALIMNCKLVEKGIFSELEALAFLISTFCHDIDHRGTSNNYQAVSRSNLAYTYYCAGSINERHHLTQTIEILNDDHSKILDSLTTEEYELVINTITEHIISSDLAYHFEVFKHLVNLNKDNCLQHKKLTMSLLMTCSDLCDQTKKWSNTKKVAEFLYREFFAQGDLEKKIGLDPQESMDRNKANIPKLQVLFINNVVLPAFDILVNILPETEHLLQAIKKNLSHWETLFAAKE